MRSPTPLLILLLAAALAACSEGGEEDKPSSGLTLAATYHLAALRTLAPLSDPLKPFPIVPQGTFPYSDLGTIALDEGKSYRVTHTGSSNQDQGRYLLDDKGILSILVPGGNNLTLALMGGAEPAGETLWFTDRYLESGGGRGDLGFWLGVRQQAGATLEGKWHVAFLSLHFAPGGTAPSPDQVARATTGSIAVDAQGAVTGELADSSLAPITGLQGKASPFPLGSMELALEWTQGGAKVSRTFRGGVGAQLFLGLGKDLNPGGGVALLVGLKALAEPVKADALSGRYHLGVATLFASPALPGSDVAAGTLELNGKDAFRATLWGQTTKPFDLSGSFAPGADGRVDFQETSPVKIPLWGAATATGGLLLLVDKEKEAADPDLSLFLAVREYQKP